MTKFMMYLLCCVLLVFTFGCGGKYSDAVDLQEDFISLAGDYVAAMDSADSADKVAAAMNDYAAGLEDMAPRVREINEKYPELSNPEQQPEQFKQTAQEHEAVMQKVGNSFMKAMPYMGDPDVRQAQQRITLAMQSMEGK
ncbi:MAG: hypothetical protein KGY42_07955 [Desulfobacterales bacterium]|nr:hypothetical protein [Desulfobacterales bacterium]MBS3754195.1 hypothetical protein [Desulfobacterales bacterium]